MTARAFFITTLLLGVLVTSPLTASSTVLLDANGAVVRLENGTYGDLFPNGTELDASHHVLALDVRSPFGQERLLVPGTESPWLEESATLVSDSDTLWALWEGRYNAIHPLLYLSGYNGDGWGDVIEITGNPFAPKGHPQLAVTRNGSEESASRVLHVVWWENLATGFRKRLAPIVLFENRQIGDTAPIDLIDFLGEVETYAEPMPELANALAIQPGSTNRTAVVGFTDPRTGRVASLVIESLPEKLGALADRIETQLLDLGKLGEEYPDLAQSLIEAILDLEDSGFLTASLEHIADQLAAIISNEDPETSLPTLGERIRAQVINIGARIERGGIAGETVIAQVELGDGEQSHWLAVTVASHRDAPEVGGPARLFLSESGKDVLLAWDDENAVTWVESAGDRWTAPASIVLDESMNRATAYSVLQQRIRSR